MSNVSNWPLPSSSSRFITPKSIISSLKNNIVSRGLYPTAFGYYQKAYGHQVYRTQHDDHLLILCVGGQGFFKSDGYETNVSTNDLLFIPKGTTHQYHANIADPWTIYWCHFEGHLFQEFMDIIGLNSQNLKLVLNDTNDFITEFKELLDTQSHGLNLGSFLLASNIGKKLLSLTCVQKNISTQNNKEFQLERIDAYLTENLTQLLTLEDMAKYMSMSKFHFAKKFKQAQGTTPLKYFMNMKIQHACVLLDTTNDTIRSIAESLGIDDPYYFSRLFKKVMGLSPKQYRNTPH